MSMAKIEQAWEICLRWADDIARRINALSSEEMEKILTVEHGGIAEIMLDIATVSRRQEHFDAGIKLLQKSVLDPLARNEDLLPMSIPIPPFPSSTAPPGPSN